MFDGTYGVPREFNKTEMYALLLNENVEHVEVFNPTPKEMKRRMDLHHRPIKVKKQRTKNKAARKSRKKTNKN